MAVQIGFDLVTNPDGFIVGAQQAEKAMQDLRSETKGLESDSKEAFEKSTKEVSGLNDQLSKGSKSTGKMIDEVQKLGKTQTIIQKLKAEIKFYTDEALKAGKGTQAFADNLAKAAKIRNELQSLNKELESLNGNIGENLARAAGHSLELLLKGFEGVIAVEALAGDEAEEFEKTLVKLQSLNALIGLTQEFAGLEDKIKEIKLGFKPLTDLYVKGNDALKAYFKNNKQGLIDVGAESKSLSAKIADVGAAGIKSFKDLWATIKANPLGAIIALAGIVFGILVSLREKVKPIAEVFEFFQRMADIVIGDLKKIGRALGILASEEEERINRTIANIDKVVAAIEARYRREIALAQAAGFQALHLEKKKLRAELEAVQETIRLLEEKSKKQGKLNKEDQEKYEKLLEQRLELENALAVAILTYDEAIEANKREKVANAIALSQAEYDRKISIAKANNLDTLALEKEKLEATRKIINEELTRLEKERKARNLVLNKAEQEERAALLQQLADLENAYAVSVIQTNQKIAEERKKLLEDFLAKIREISQRVQEAQDEKLSGEDRIEREKELQLQELTALKASLIAKGQAQEDFEAKVAGRQATHFELSLEQEEQFNILSEQIYNRATAKLLQLQADRQSAANEATKAGIDSSLELLEIQQQAEEDAILAVRKPAGIKQEDFETQQQIKILEIRKKYALGSVAVKKAQIDAEADLQVQQLENEISILRARGDAASIEQANRLQNAIDNIRASSDAQKDAVGTSVRALVTDIENQIDELNNKQSQFSLAKLFGITDQDLSNIQQSLADIGEAVKAALQVEIDTATRKIEASQKEQEERKANIDSLKSKLENEQRLNQEGKANNLQRINEEIQQEEIARQNALAEEKKLKKEREELAKQQIIIDSIVQGSNLVVAASQIYATVAKDPVSTGIATLTVAAMIAAFAAQKIAAFDAVKKENNFARGVFDLEGPGTETSDSINANLSKGETVFTAQQTRDNYDLFKGIFYEDHQLFDQAIRDLIKDRGIILSPQLPASLNTTKDWVRNAESKSVFINDHAPVTSQLSQMNKRMIELVKQNKTKIYTDQFGNLVKQTGSHSVIIKNG